MATSQYTYHPFHTIGAATLLVWDPAAASGSGAWQHLGRVADASINVLTEQVGKDLVIKGLSQPIARRNRSKRYSLSFRMLENANPATLDLLFSEGSQQTSTAGGLRATSEVLRFFGEEYVELSHPYGIPQNALDAVSEMQVSVGGSGGMIPPGTYYYWVAPALEDPGKPPIEGLTAIAGPVSVAAGEVVTITFLGPSGYQPDKYRVYYNTSSTLDGAQLIGESLTGSPFTVPAHFEQGLYQGPAAPVIQVWTYDAATPYALETDYVLNVGRGILKRSEHGAIADSESILVVYVTNLSVGIETPLGDCTGLDRNRRIRLLQLSPAESGSANWRETGLTFELYRVNVSVNDTGFAFSEDEFGEGLPVTWDCLYDGSQGRVGTVCSRFEVLENY